MSDVEALSIWTVYAHPRDFPNSFVARRFYGETPTADVIVGPDLEFIRDRLAAKGLVHLTRAPTDDPVIVETWL